MRHSGIMDERYILAHHDAFVIEFGTEKKGLSVIIDSIVVRIVDESRLAKMEGGTWPC